MVHSHHITPPPPQLQKRSHPASETIHPAQDPALTKPAAATIIPDRRRSSPALLLGASPEISHPSSLPHSHRIHSPRFYQSLKSRWKELPGLIGSSSNSQELGVVSALREEATGTISSPPTYQSSLSSEHNNTQIITTPIHHTDYDSNSSISTTMSLFQRRSQRKTANISLAALSAVVSSPESSRQEYPCEVFSSGVGSTCSRVILERNVDHHGDGPTIETPRPSHRNRLLTAGGRRQPSVGDSEPHALLPVDTIRATGSRKSLTVETSASTFSDDGAEKDGIRSAGNRFQSRIDPHHLQGHGQSRGSPPKPTTRTTTAPREKQGNRHRHREDFTPIDSPPSPAHPHPHRAYHQRQHRSPEKTKERSTILETMNRQQQPLPLSAPIGDYQNHVGRSLRSHSSHTHLSVDRPSMRSERNRSHRISSDKHPPPPRPRHHPAAGDDPERLLLPSPELTLQHRPCAAIASPSDPDQMLLSAPPTSSSKSKRVKRKTDSTKSTKTFSSLVDQFRRHSVGVSTHQVTTPQPQPEPDRTDQSKKRRDTFNFPSPTLPINLKRTSTLASSKKRVSKPDQPPTPRSPSFVIDRSVPTSANPIMSHPRRTDEFGMHLAHHQEYRKHFDTPPSHGHQRSQTLPPKARAPVVADRRRDGLPSARLTLEEIWDSFRNEADMSFSQYNSEEEDEVKIVRGKQRSRDPDEDDSVIDSKLIELVDSFPSPPAPCVKKDERVVKGAHRSRDRVTPLRSSFSSSRSSQSTSSNSTGTTCILPRSPTDPNHAHHQPVQIGTRPTGHTVDSRLDSFLGLTTHNLDDPVSKIEEKEVTERLKMGFEGPLRAKEVSQSREIEWTKVPKRREDEEGTPRKRSETESEEEKRRRRAKFMKKYGLKGLDIIESQERRNAFEATIVHDPSSDEHGWVSYGMAL